eukprot:3812665-Rhodomonas_salina.2
MERGREGERMDLALGLERVSTARDALVTRLPVILQHAADTVQVQPPSLSSLLCERLQHALSVLGEVQRSLVAP